MDMMVAGSMDSIVMVEGEMAEVSEDEMVDAIEAAHKAIQAQCEAQIALAKAQVIMAFNANIRMRTTMKICASRVNEALTDNFMKRPGKASRKKSERLLSRN